jgi:hypothetical protein
MRIGLASIAAAGALAACGNSALEPGAGDDPGTGTQTLVVDGFAYASPRQSAAHTGADFDTLFAVRVSLNGQPMAVGAVTVTSATGKVSLTYGDAHRWEATAPGYDEVYVLDVVHGSDRAEGMRVDGPDIHVFTEPAENASVDATIPLVVRWKASARAELATLQIESGAVIAIGDTGMLTLPAGTLRADRLQARHHTLHLARGNEVTPSGTASGSSFRVSIENTLDVITPPLPL